VWQVCGRLVPRQTTIFQASVVSTGASAGGWKKKSDRKPDPAFGGQRAGNRPKLLGRQVKAGDHLAWRRMHRPGRLPLHAGAADEPEHAPAHFFCYRDPADNRWYFIDPYGIFAYPKPGYSSGVTAAASGACVRYSVGWKGGHPQYPYSSFERRRSARRSVTIVPPQRRQPVSPLVCACTG